MNETKIETADYTWNFMTGCDQVCFDGDCYAYQLIQRFGKTWGYDWTPRIHLDRLTEPEELKTPSLIFAPSMGDPMTPSLSMDDIWLFFDEIEVAHWHRFQVQTKFAKRLPEFRYPSNVWLGVSLCYESDLPRLDYLKKTNARIKYAYCEPLLEELTPDFSGIDWVVIGAKTGARPFQPKEKWIYDLTILALNAGAKVFHKPNLAMKALPCRYFPDEEWFEWRKSSLKETSQ